MRVYVEVPMLKRDDLSQFNALEIKQLTAQSRVIFLR